MITANFVHHVIGGGILGIYASAVIGLRKTTYIFQDKDGGIVSSVILLEQENDMQQREIKFRAWDEQSKKMLPSVDISRPVKYFDWLGGLDVPIMQYTGLKDKNGKEIFEGDVLEYATIWAGVADSPHYKVGDKVVHRRETVVFEPFYFADYEDSCAGFGWKIDTCDLEEIGKRWEIIGNIYENPELLT